MRKIDTYSYNFRYQEGGYRNPRNSQKTKILRNLQEKRTSMEKGGFYSINLDINKKNSGFNVNVSKINKL